MRWIFDQIALERSLDRACDCSNVVSNDIGQLLIFESMQL